jgi:hypothetical protein
MASVVKIYGDRTWLDLDLEQLKLRPLGHQMQSAAPIGMLDDQCTLNLGINCIRR